MKYKKIYWSYPLLSGFLLFVIALTVNCTFFQNLDFFAGYFIYFSVIFFVLTKRKSTPQKTLFLFLIGLLLLDLPIRFFEGWEDSFISIPRLIIEIFGCISGYLFFRLKGVVLRTLITLISIFILFIYTSVLSPYWVHYTNFKNFTAKENIQAPIGWSAYTKTNDSVSADSYQNKIVIFDFWNTGCGVCFRKFPKLQRLYDQYKTDTNIIIQAVNIPLERDTFGMAYKIILEKKYTFPVVIGSVGMGRLFAVSSYPTTIVLKNQRVLFRGDIDEAAKYLRVLAR